MMSNPRAAYLGASVSTASPARLLVMLCERLVLDVTRGRNAQAEGDHAEAHRQLLHAQEIVLELRMSLDVKAWDGGPALASIYDFLHSELVRANMSKDLDRTEGCLKLVTDLCATWRDAALQAASVPSVA